MIPAWVTRLGLGAGAAYLKRRLKGEGKEVAGDIRKKILAKLAKERDKYMPEHLKEKAKKIEFYQPVRNAKDAKEFIKDILGDKGAKKPSGKSLRGKLHKIKIKKEPTSKQIAEMKKRRVESEKKQNKGEDRLDFLTKLDKKREARTGEKNTYVKLHEKKVTKSVENYRKDDLTKKINEARKSDDEILLMKKALKDFDKIHPEYRRLKRKLNEKEK